MKRVDDLNNKTRQWMVDLVNTDLSTIDDYNLQKQILDAKHFLIGRWPHFPYITIFPESTGKAFNTFQTSMLSRFETLSWEEALPLIRKEIHDAIEDIIESDRAYSIAHMDHDDGHIYMEKKGEMIPWSPLARTDICINTVYSVIGNSIRLGFCLQELSVNDLEPLLTPEIFAKQAKLEFYILMNGLPSNSIDTCKRCGKYFLRLTEKPKYYCSQKCGAAHLSQKKREENREEYNAKQREIMRKKYQEKDGRQARARRDTKKK